LPTCLPCLPAGRRQAGEDNLDGFQEDSDLQKEGHILDIKEVILQLFNGIFNRCSIGIIYLGQTCDSTDHYDIKENNGRK